MLPGLMKGSPMSLVLALWLAAVATPAPPPADLVLTEGAFYTMDAARSWASALAVREGRITLPESQAMRRFYEAELVGYTYLEP